MHFVIAGGSGYVGGHLSLFLVNHGHEVTILSRSQEKQCKLSLCTRFKYDFDKIDLITFHDYSVYDGSGDVLINLAGENIGEKRVCTRRLASLLESRLRVLQHLQDCPKLPPLFFQASGVACYPNGAEEQNEGSAVDESSDFGKLALTLEQEVLKLNKKFHFKHYYFMRLGIVLSHDGGFMRKLKYVPPFCFLHGDNKIPFIGMEDLVRAVLFITENDLHSGPVNFTAPDYATINEILASCFKFVWLPQIPLVNLFLKKGDRRTDLILADQKIKPQYLLDAGFEFHAPSIGCIVPPKDSFIRPF